MSRRRKKLPDIVAIIAPKATNRPTTGMSEAVDPVGAQVDARFAPGQQVGHQRAGPRAEAEADMPLADGENGIPMTRRRPYHRDRVQPGAPIAHPAALPATVHLGKPAPGIAVHHHRPPPALPPLIPPP